MFSLSPPPRPLVQRSSHVSLVSRWTVSSLNGPGTGFSWAKVRKEKFSSYRLPAHVFRYLQQTIWQLTRSWQILFGVDDNELLRRSPWDGDARGRLAAHRIENIEFQQSGKNPAVLFSAITVS